MNMPTRALSLFLSLLASTVAYGNLTLQIESVGAVVTGATSGHQIAFFGLAHETDGYEGTIARYEEVLTADAAGAATWPLQNISSRSLWFAIDVQTGTVAAATPEGFPLRSIEPPADVIVPRDLADVLDVPFFYAEILFVRPGSGAWLQSASRGGSNDLESKANALTVAPGSFRKFKGTDSGPAKMQVNDGVIVIDPYALSFFSVRWEQ
jgi:hypothetical protein